MPLPKSNSNRDPEPEVDWEVDWRVVEALGGPCGTRVCVGRNNRKDCDLARNVDIQWGDDPFASKCSIKGRNTTLVSRMC